MNRAKLSTVAGIVLCVLLASCSGPKADAIVVVDGTGSSQVFGEVSFERDAQTGSFQPQLWKQGNLLFFRAARMMSDGFSAKAGTIYRVGKNRELEEGGTFDVNESSENLRAKHLTGK